MTVLYLTIMTICVIFLTISVLLSRVRLLQLGIFDGGFLSPLVHHRPCLKGTQRILQVQCRIMISQVQNNCRVYSLGIISYA